MNEKYFMYAVLALVIVFVVFYVATKVSNPKKENFAPFVSGPDTYFKSVDTSIQDSTVLSNGTVQKYKENGVYTYKLFFNLPVVGSSFQTSNLDLPFNSQISMKNYIVKFGSSMNDLITLGELQRQPDGYHTLDVTSENDYTYVCVYLGSSLVNCVKI